ncbi:WD repeat-containing protein 31 like protein [Aduncisulcus paluster]|uniref:WD repeat-containing protein 31 like protein n=1 Tax=Aduncisulcus paluster TaxID=2918883 RepID=A0ABQ5KWS0_9EUKA|nr:WD repeat-containing protein 31 like protein [Aduncisulcus paluster]
MGVCGSKTTIYVSEGEKVVSGGNLAHISDVDINEEYLYSIDGFLSVCPLASSEKFALLDIDGVIYIIDRPFERKDDSKTEISPRTTSQCPIIDSVSDLPLSNVITSHLSDYICLGGSEGDISLCKIDDSMDSSSFISSPVSTLSHHTLGVSDLISLSETQLFSSSRDCTVCLWDVEKSEAIQYSYISRNVGKKVLQINEHLVLQAGEDLNVKLWDIRDLRTPVYVSSPSLHICSSLSLSSTNRLQPYVGRAGCGNDGGLVLMLRPPPPPLLLLPTLVKMHEWDTEQEDGVLCVGTIGQSPVTVHGDGVVLWNVKERSGRGRSSRSTEDGSDDESIFGVSQAWHVPIDKQVCSACVSDDIVICACMDGTIYSV